MFMHTRMHVCMYVCTYVSLYARMYVCMYVRMYVGAPMSVCRSLSIPIKLDLFFAYKHISVSASMFEYLC